MIIKRGWVWTPSTRRCTTYPCGSSWLGCSSSLCPSSISSMMYSVNQRMWNKVCSKSFRMLNENQHDAFTKKSFNLIFSGTKNLCQFVVILFLLAGLAWAIVGFVWIFGAHDIKNMYCGHNSTTYWVRKPISVLLAIIKIVIRTKWNLINKEILFNNTTIFDTHISLFKQNWALDYKDMALRWCSFIT